MELTVFVTSEKKSYRKLAPFLDTVQAQKHDTSISGLHVAYLIQSISPHRLVRQSIRGKSGIETSFAPHWTAKLEYLYVDLGKHHLLDVIPGLPETVTFSANIIRVGVNYSFSGPVVAKY